VCVRDMEHFLLLLCIAWIWLDLYIPFPSVLFLYVYHDPGIAHAVAFLLSRHDIRL
jgi:hypothetical protein